MSATSERDPGRELDDKLPTGHTAPPEAQTASSASLDEDEQDEEEEEEDDREPNLKYTRLTSSLSSVYRNGDSTSSFLVSGDKMIIGTHNGNVHVMSIGSLQSLRLYHAHSSSITAISTSPFSSSVAVPVAEQASSSSTGTTGIPTKAASARTPSSSIPNSPRYASVAATPSNSIYIATASIDGHVCVSSLVDPKDVMLRNYARPVQAVALSPDYKNDRTYLSGGTAGSLILTVGGRTGVSADANTNSAAAAASGWLGAIGLGSNTGKDVVLHSGEGHISTIKWSLTGRYVCWVNEQGSKIMRSNLHHEGAESDLTWKRIAHIARPNRRTWEDMAGVWRARVEWVDEKLLEFSDTHTQLNGKSDGHAQTENVTKQAQKKRTQRLEKLLVGWGDTVWMIHITCEIPRGSDLPSAGKAEIVHQFVFSDGVVSGLTLYTPSLLLALVYRTHDDDNNPIATTQEDTPRRGIRRRHNGVPPDLRLIDLESPGKDEVEVEGLNVSRFETLTAGDYHLSSIFNPSIAMQQATQRGTLEVIGDGLWEVGVGATRLGVGATRLGVGLGVGVGQGATRLFSSGASVLSGGSNPSAASSGDRGSISGVSVSTTRQPRPATSVEVLPPMSKPGLKIFIQSPFDCVLAIKRDRSDRLAWLLEHELYKESWELIDKHPEILSGSSFESQPSTPSNPKTSLKDFFEDDTSSGRSVATQNKARNSAVEKEKRRIGDLWVQQLVTADDWVTAGITAGKVLATSSSWEYWILAFAHANKFDEITPYIPIDQLKPPLPSLVYEIVLGHYIVLDSVRFKDLLDQWSFSLYDISSVTAAIESKIDAGDVRQDSVEDGIQGRDWHILYDCLAKLYIADDRPTEGLRCYIRTQHADAALGLIRDYQLIDAVSNDVYRFMTIRITTDQLAKASVEELEACSSEPTRLLVTAAIQDVISVDSVVSQLESEGDRARPLLFFFFQAMWRGEGDSSAFESAVGSTRRSSNQTFVARSRFDATTNTDSISKALLAPHGNLVVTLFADYSRTLLVDYLRNSSDYTYEHASAICEEYHYITELVHLLSATGQTKRALHLIIDELGDVIEAINFAKEIDEESLWTDLLDYSMNEPGKPAFIRGLLEEVGTTINPVTLVHRIPEGLEIQGLKQGLGRLVRESEIMYSISEGAAKVLRGEVVDAQGKLRKDRAKGVLFEIPGHIITSTSEDRPARPALKPAKGSCASCKSTYASIDNIREYLIGFPCGHIFHLTCLLDTITHDANDERVSTLQTQLASSQVESDTPFYADGKVANKMAHAQMLKVVLGARGCILCGSGEEASLVVEENGE